MSLVERYQIDLLTTKVDELKSKLLTAKSNLRVKDQHIENYKAELATLNGLAATVREGAESVDQYNASVYKVVALRGMLNRMGSLNTLQTGRLQGVEECLAMMTEDATGET